MASETQEEAGVDSAALMDEWTNAFFLDLPLVELVVWSLQCALGESQTITVGHKTVCVQQCHTMEGLGASEVVGPTV